MSGFQPDERVKVTLPDVRIVVDEFGVTVKDEKGNEYPLPPGVEIERVAPAEWPQPCDIWADGDDGLWFAQQYYADFDNEEDQKGANEHGWRVVMVPLNGGPYGAQPGRVEDIHRSYNLKTLVWRPAAKPADDGESAEDRPVYPAPGSEIPDQPGYVVGECGHRVAASEWRAGFRVCERCPSDDWADEPAEGGEAK
jgi:hypothetical protein